MQIDLSGGIALVTGSTQAIATGLAQAGAHVVVNGRGADRVATVRVTPEGSHRRHELRADEIEDRYPGVLSSIVAAIHA